MHFFPGEDGKGVIVRPSSDSSEQELIKHRFG